MLSVAAKYLSTPPGKDTLERDKAFQKQVQQWE